MAVLALHPVVTGMLVVLFVVISVMMMLVVLIQRPSGGGLSGAFGSASEGAGQTAFGAKTGDALTTATIVIFLLFLLCAVGLNYALQPPEAVAAPAQASDEGAAAPNSTVPAGTTTTPTAPPETPAPAPAPAPEGTGTAPAPTGDAPAPAGGTDPAGGTGSGG